MEESPNSSPSRDVVRTTTPPAILHHPTPLQQATPNPVPSVIEVNRSLRSSRRSHAVGNQPTLNETVSSTLGLQPHIYHPQAAVWQQHPPFVSYFAKDNNINCRQWDVTGVQDNIGALAPPVVRHEGLAERRQDRSPPAVERNTGNTPSQVYLFITGGQSDPAQPTKRVKTDDEKRDLRQLKEKGEACLRCHQEQKACDREDVCWKCRLPQPGHNPMGEATLCFRGIEKLWLWRAREQTSLDQGSRKTALHRARNTTFADSSQQLRRLPRLGQALPGSNMFPVVYLTSKLGDSTATSQIVMSSGSLAETLQSMPGILTKQFKTALAAHIPDLVLPSLQTRLTAEEKPLLTSAQSAFRVFNFLSNAVHVQYHASLRSSSLARVVSCFLVEYCARLLATEVEEVLEKIRAMIRKNKDPGNVTKHAFGLYYGILAGLRQWNTQSALDVVLKPLILRAFVVMADLNLLYRNIYGSTETLQDFVNREIPVRAEIKNLHLSHDLRSAINNPVIPWDLPCDPFHKDFWVHLRNLLVLDGRVGWTPELHPVQRGVLSPQCSEAADTSPLQRGRSEASEPGPSLSYKSPNATLLDSPSWGDLSTLYQSPTEVEHGAELGHWEQGQAGDVKIPEDLRGITGQTSTHVKRGLSPQSISSSPSPKRPELDEWHLLLDDSENRFFAEEYAITMHAR